MAKLKVGIVGCGKIANCNHIPGYKSCKNVEIVALCDIVPEKMTKTIEDNKLENVTCFNSLDELLAAKMVDAVSICTPNDCHYPQTITCLKAGLNVLCDKPMAFNTDQCATMLKTAKEVGKVLHINHSWHYMGISNKMRKMIAEGKIGEFRSATCVFNCCNPPHIAWSPGADWFVQAKHEGSIIQDIAVHLGEMLQWIPSTQVTEVASMTNTFFPGIDVVDNFAAIFRYENKATANLDLSWTAPADYFFMEFKGSEGAIYLRNWAISYRKRGAKKERAIKATDFKCNSQQNFIATILGKGEQLTSGVIGREAIAICNAITESGKTGNFAKVKKF